MREWREEQWCWVTEGHPQQWAWGGVQSLVRYHGELVQEQTSWISLNWKTSHKLHQPQKHQQQMQKGQKQTLKDKVVWVTHPRSVGTSRERDLLEQKTLWPPVGHVSLFMCPESRQQGEGREGAQGRERNLSRLSIYQQKKWGNNLKDSIWKLKDIDLWWEILLSPPQQQEQLLTQPHKS